MASSSSKSSKKKTKSKNREAIDGEISENQNEEISPENNVEKQILNWNEEIQSAAEEEPKKKKKYKEKKDKNKSKNESEKNADKSDKLDEPDKSEKSEKKLERESLRKRNKELVTLIEKVCRKYEKRLQKYEKSMESFHIKQNGELQMRKCENGIMCISKSQHKCECGDDLYHIKFERDNYHMASDNFPTTCMQKCVCHCPFSNARRRSCA